VRKQQLDDIREDRILGLATQLKAVLDSEVDPTAVQLAALRLLTKGVTTNYLACVGPEHLQELLRQVNELTQQYAVLGPDGNEEA
jgi:hypothetical protein